MPLGGQGSSSRVPREGPPYQALAGSPLLLLEHALIAFPDCTGWAGVIGCHSIHCLIFLQLHGHFFFASLWDSIDEYR